MNIHSTYLSTVYGDYARIAEAVAQVRPARLRDKLSPRANHPQQALWRSMGIKLHLSAASYGETIDRAALKQRMIEMSDLIVQLAGYNEPDSDGEPMDRWLPTTVEWQNWLWETVKSTPELSHIKVVGPVLRGGNENLAVDFETLYTAIEGKYDLANMHIYPHGGDPEPYLDDRIQIANGRRFVISEGGYNTGLGITPGGNPVTEEVQRDLTVRYVQYAASKRIRLFIYELMDDPDPAWNDWHAHWGTHRADYSPKPVVPALAAL